MTREFIAHLDTLNPAQVETHFRAMFAAERPGNAGTTFGILNEWARTPGGSGFGDGDLARMEAKTALAADIVTGIFAGHAPPVVPFGSTTEWSAEQSRFAAQIPTDAQALPGGESAYVLLGRIHDGNPRLGAPLPDSLALYHGSGAEALGYSQDQFFALEPAVQRNLGSFDADNPLGVTLEQFVGFDRYRVAGLNALDAPEAAAVQRDILDEADGGKRVRAAGLDVSEVGDVTGDIIGNILANPERFLQSFVAEGAIGAVPVLGQVYELYELGAEGAEVVRAINEYRVSHRTLQEADDPERPLEGGSTTTSAPDADPAIALTPGQFELAATCGTNRGHLTIEEGRVSVDLDSSGMSGTARQGYENLVARYDVETVSGLLHAYDDGGIANLPPQLSAADVADIVVVHTNPDGNDAAIVHDLQHAVTERGVSEFEEALTHDTTTDAFMAYAASRGYDYFDNGRALSTRELGTIERALEMDWDVLQGGDRRLGHRNEFRSANAGNALDKTL